jgi:hypothetical protein
VGQQEESLHAGMLALIVQSIGGGGGGR